MGQEEIFVKGNSPHERTILISSSIGFIAIAKYG
jgi:hypothetical protein